MHTYGNRGQRTTNCGCETTQVPPEVQCAAAVLSYELLAGQVIGQSSAIRSLLELAKLYASSDDPVLISGETGTGKEVFARTIHNVSLRSSGPFVAVNCGALPEGLIENELFGHAAGAFTSAARASEGRIGQAESGTLFLDEINSIPASAQSKVLRLLQFRQYSPLGSTIMRRADVRFISASNKDLEAAVTARSFREDLYYRLSVLSLNLPPLRERPQDIPLLANHLLLRRASALAAFRAAHQPAQNADPAPAAPLPSIFTQAALEKLMSCNWPGNVRQLENVIARALLMARGGVIDAADLQILASTTTVNQRSYKAEKAQAIWEFDERYLREIAANHGGKINLTRGAKEAGKDLRSFRRLVHQHKVSAIQDADSH